MPTSRVSGKSSSGADVGGILVVGAAGFIGRSVLAEARSAGAAEAVVAGPWDGDPRAHVLRLSARTVDPLARLLASLSPKAIVNCAGRTSGTADELWQANVGSVAALLDAMRVAGSGARLVHLGSAAEYAEIPDRATDEEAELDPSTPYAAAKVAAFQLVSEAAEAGFDTIVARVFNPIGAGMPATSLPGRAVRLLSEGAAAGAEEVELGPLGAVRDYVDLPDISRGVCLLATHPRLAHRVYNIGTGRPTRVRDLVRLIADRVGFAGAIGESAAASPRSHRVMWQVADVGRLRSAGWTPTTELAAAVDALVSTVGQAAAGHT